MKRPIIFLLLAHCFVGTISAQDRITGDPDSASIITADITRFWQAFDSLKSQKTTGDSMKVIKQYFVDQASEGLRQYMKAAGCNEKDYLDAVRRRKADYLAVRGQTEAVGGEKLIVRRYLRKFKQLYPALKIPAICFTIGKFEVGGSQFPNTLYIGCEVDAIHGIDIIPQSMHELAHFQQKDQDPSTNLELAMIEGGAEFVCYRLTGKRTIPATWKYGIAHEAELWKEFQPVLDSPIVNKWFLDNPDTVKNRPGSLAYFIGFRVCEAYLKASRNKKAALKELVEMQNPKKIARGSLYNP
jgi:hypothetical protein